MNSKPSEYNKRYRWFYPTREETLVLRDNYVIREAGLYQVMGPHYRDIYFLGSQRRPCVIYPK